MYESPIKIIQGQLETQMEGMILKAVQKVDVNVDKEELIRALQYDRGQYEKGYDDAKASIVRCKDCHNCTKSNWCNLLMMDVKDEWYCSHGERRDGE